MAVGHQALELHLRGDRRGLEALERLDPVRRVRGRHHRRCVGDGRGRGVRDGRWRGVRDGRRRCVGDRRCVSDGRCGRDCRARRRSGCAGLGGRGLRELCAGGRGRVHGRFFRRIGLAVVGAAELDAEFGGGLRRQILGQRLRLPELLERERVPGDGEATERRLQRGEAVLAALIERDREVRAPLEAALGELREDRVGADLDERARAGRVHRLDLFDEAHRARDRIGELLARRVRVRGIDGRGRVRVIREARGPDDDAVEELAERGDRRAHER